MRIFFIIFLFFINKVVVAQQLHHQMISAQGGSVTTTAFPNPFVNEINFSFSTSPGDKISAYVFDVLGRLVYSEDVKNENNSIKLNLVQLSTAEYLVKLTSEKFVHSAKIIKQ